MNIQWHSSLRLVRDLSLLSCVYGIILIVQMNEWMNALLVMRPWHSLLSSFTRMLKGTPQEESLKILSSLSCGYQIVVIYLNRQLDSLEVEGQSACTQRVVYFLESNHERCANQSEKAPDIICIMISNTRQTQSATRVWNLKNQKAKLPLGPMW